MSVNQKKTNIVLTLLKSRRLCYNIRVKSVGRFDVKKENRSAIVKSFVFFDIFCKNARLNDFAPCDARRAARPDERKRTPRPAKMEKDAKI